MMPRYTWPRTAHCDGGSLMAAVALTVAAVACTSHPSQREEPT